MSGATDLSTEPKPLTEEFTMLSVLSKRVRFVHVIKLLVRKSKLITEWAILKATNYSTRVFFCFFFVFFS